MLSLTVACVAFFKFFEIRPIRSVKSCNQGCRGVHRSEAGITMTSAGEPLAPAPVLQQLALLTAERDLELLEAQLLRTVHMLLRAREVYWLRTDHSTDRYFITKLHIDKGELVVYPREDGRISQDPPYGWVADDWDKIVAAVQSGEILPVAAGVAGFSLFPLRPHEATLGSVGRASGRE